MYFSFVILSVACLYDPYMRFCHHLQVIHVRLIIKKQLVFKWPIV